VPAMASDNTKLLGGLEKKDQVLFTEHEIIKCFGIENNLRLNDF
jgi:hypothetical protein